MNLPIEVAEGIKNTVLNKLDEVPGFREFWENLPEDDRDEVEWEIRSAIESLEMG